MTYPQRLLDILQADETLGDTFTGYNASINDTTITLSKAESDTFTFTVSEAGAKATGEINGDNYEVAYTSGTITKKVSTIELP